MTRRRQAGFTLVELLVVITIVGILVSLAIVYMRPRIRPIDVATRFGDLVREASRRAVALGPVRSDVVLTRAVTEGMKGARSRTRITAELTPNAITFPLSDVTFKLSAYQEDLLPNPWVELQRYTTSSNVTSAAWAPGVGNASMGGQSTDWTAFTASCWPDGTCDSRTLFFQAAIPVPVYELKAKVSIMPLGGAITTQTDWN